MPIRIPAALSDAHCRDLRSITYQEQNTWTHRENTLLVRAATCKRSRVHDAALYYHEPLDGNQAPGDGVEQCARCCGGNVRFVRLYYSIDCMLVPKRTGTVGCYSG
ncbi:MAG: hypothetical protein HC828_14840 [Blastochloris sp.]|nr:hypothetical protein [Blastochloris sp.]